MMMKRTVFLLFALLVTIVVMMTMMIQPTLANEQQQPVEEKFREYINPNAADKPFQDQKDLARIETCIGPCLNAFSGARDFIMKQSMKYTGLQTMFIGEYPKLIIYDPSGLVTQEYDMRELSVEQIEETMQKHGLSKMKQ